MHIYLSIYYKERRQLKIFLIQIGPALPLTFDPLVVCFWKRIGWKDYEVPKNRNLESVSVKIIMFLLPKCCLPTYCTHTWTHTHESPCFSTHVAHRDRAPAPSACTHPRRTTPCDRNPRPHVRLSSWTLLSSIPP
jgi:hypothetical protein